MVWEKQEATGLGHSPGPAQREKGKEVGSWPLPEVGRVQKEAGDQGVPLAQAQNEQRGPKELCLPWIFLSMYPHWEELASGGFLEGMAQGPQNHFASDEAPLALP